MNVTIIIPDDVAGRLGSQAELQRRALEALAHAEYRAGRLDEVDLQQMLGVVDATQDPGTSADDLVEQFKAFRAGKTLGGIAIKELIVEGRR